MYWQGPFEEKGQEMIGKLGFSHAPIDIHSHFNHGSPFDCPEDESHIRSMEFVESVYASYGISQVGISTYASVLNHTECIFEENAFLHRMKDEKGWLYQWVAIDPRNPETFGQAEKMLHQHKVLGIKIHPAEHGYNILEHGDELFSFANEHKAVVLMHPQHLLKMTAFADRYPEMKLILAHIGSKDYVDVIANAKHGNIYTDTSGGASSRNNIIEYAVNRIGSEKILFGTDMYSFAFQFGRIALSELSMQDKENILWKNAVKLFPGVLK